MRYTTDKVLYFANKECLLHVDINEGSKTDLSKIVRSLLDKKLIRKEANDDSGSYYETTTKGKKRLLELQIEWRKAHGKDTSGAESKLKEIEGEL